MVAALNAMISTAAKKINGRCEIREIFNPLGVLLRVENGDLLKEYYFPPFPMDDYFGKDRLEKELAKREKWMSQIAETFKQAVKDFENAPNPA